MCLMSPPQGVGEICAEPRKQGTRAAGARSSLTLCPRFVHWATVTTHSCAPNLSHAPPGVRMVLRRRPIVAVRRGRKPPPDDVGALLLTVAAAGGPKLLP